MHEIRFLNRNSTSILQDTILLYLGRIMVKQSRVNFKRPLIKTVQSFETLYKTVYLDRITNIYT